MKNKSKKTRKDNQQMTNIKNMSFLELYAMHTFAKSTEERSFTNLSKNTKVFLKNRTSEIENELFSRTFGYNPFVVQPVQVPRPTSTARPAQMPVVIQGQKPESIDLTKFDGERFVVSKNEVAEKKE